MRKFWIFLVILCLVTGSMTVSAENFDVRDTITPGETKIVTIPKPEGEIDPGVVYFTQAFTFVPEEDGTYRFLISYQEDGEKPYDIFMDVAGEYRALENGCEFDAIAAPHRASQAPQSDKFVPSRIHAGWQFQTAWRPHSSSDAPDAKSR